MPLDFALILLFFAIAVPWLGRRRIRLLMSAAQTEKRDRLLLYGSTFVFQWAAVGVIYWRSKGHHISATDLGIAFRGPGLVAFVSVALCLLIFANQVFSLRRLAARPQEIKGTAAQLALKIFPQDNSERAAFLGLSATVAICEEFIYRGFAQHILENWPVDYVAAGIFGSALLFALAHLYQGGRGLLSTFFVGVVFAGIRVWTGSLLPDILAHFVADSSAGLLAPGIMRTALQPTNSNSSADCRDSID